MQPAVGGEAQCLRWHRCSVRENASPAIGHANRPAQFAAYHSNMQVPEAAVNAINDAIGQRLAAFQQEYGQMEPGLSVVTSPAAPPAACLTVGGAQQVLDLLLTLPHGVIKNSHAVAGGLLIVCCVRLDLFSLACIATAWRQRACLRTCAAALRSVCRAGGDQLQPGVHQGARSCGRQG